MATNRSLTVAVLWLATSCGYQPVHAAHAELLHVVLARSMVADAVAADEVVSGVREELARVGALAPGESYPRVEVEVVRAGEASEGIQAAAGGPSARATDVSIVARAWIARGPSEPQEAETGDLEAEETAAADPTAEASELHHADALRAAARRLGRKLGDRVLGLPAAGEDTAD